MTVADLRELVNDSTLDPHATVVVLQRHPFQAFILERGHLEFREMPGLPVPPYRAHDHKK